MYYIPDIYDLTNIGIVVFIVFTVVIVLWAVYDWEPKEDGGDRGYYSWDASRRGSKK